MSNNKEGGEDSVYLEANNNFFQSQSSQNQYLPDYNLYSNFSQKEGINEFDEFPQINSRLSSQIRSRQVNNNTLKRENTDFEIRESVKSGQKQKKIERQSKDANGNRKKPASQKKKHNSKNYRQRKKQYIQKLQDEHYYYKNRTAQLEQKVILLQRQVCQLKYDHDNVYKSGYEQLYGKDLEALKATIDANNTPLTEIIRMAQKLRERYGPAGHQRKTILNYYMSQYINATMGDFQKYIFSSVLKKSGPFGESKSLLDDKIDEVLQLTQVQKMNLTKKVFPELYPLAVSYSNCCKNIYKDYVKLLDEANKFHKMMENGLNYVVIPQLTKMVIWFQDYKNMPEVRRLKQEWIRIFSGQIQPQSYYT